MAYGLIVENREMSDDSARSVRARPQHRTSAPRGVPPNARRAGRSRDAHRQRLGLAGRTAKVLRRATRTRVRRGRTFARPHHADAVRGAHARRRRPNRSTPTGIAPCGPAVGAGEATSRPAPQPALTSRSRHRSCAGRRKRRSALGQRPAERNQACMRPRASSSAANDRVEAELGAQP